MPTQINYIIQFCFLSATARVIGLPSANEGKGEGGTAVYTGDNYTVGDYNNIDPEVDTIIPLQ